jgi:hypothetical protein
MPRDLRCRDPKLLSAPIGYNLSHSAHDPPPPSLFQLLPIYPRLLTFLLNNPFNPFPFAPQPKLAQLPFLYLAKNPLHREGGR